MSKYYVVFTQEWGYEVEAKNERDAEDLAFKEFKQEMMTPVACTDYSYIRIADLEDEWQSRDL